MDRTFPSLKKKKKKDRTYRYLKKEEEKKDPIPNCRQDREMSN